MQGTWPTAEQNAPAAVIIDVDVDVPAGDGQPVQPGDGGKEEGDPESEYGIIAFLRSSATFVAHHL